MIRGTTPTITFNLPFAVSLIDKIWVTFSQFNAEVFTIENVGLEMKDLTISVKLTQEQTLLLNHNFNVDIQLRILTKNSEAMASNIIKTDIGRILKEGVIE